MATNPQQQQQQQLSLRHSVPGTVYVLHFEPAYKHARHYIGWTSDTDVTARLNVHLQGRGSPLVRAAVQAGVEVQSPRPTRAPATSNDASSAGTRPASSAPSVANTAAAAHARTDPVVQGTAARTGARRTAKRARAGPGHG
jgi:hypothetical protein